MNRISRGIFHYIRKKGWPQLATRLHNLSKMFELRMWSTDSPLLQFNIISNQMMAKIEDSKLTVEKILESREEDIDTLLKRRTYGQFLKGLANALPKIKVTANLEAISRNDAISMTLDLKITTDFYWEDKYCHSYHQLFWIYISDIDSNRIYFSKCFRINRNDVIYKKAINYKCDIEVDVPDMNSLPTQFKLYSSPDQWFGSEVEITISPDIKVIQ